MQVINVAGMTGLDGSWRCRSWQAKGDDPSIEGEEEEGETGLLACPLRLGPWKCGEGVCAVNMYNLFLNLITAWDKQWKSCRCCEVKQLSKEF